MTLRVAVGGFQHETNTFAAAPTPFEDFERADGWPGLTRGEAMFDALRGYNIGIAGCLDGAVDAGFDVVPLAWCGGGAGGLVSRDAWERGAASLLDPLREAGPVDGVLLDLHGAMVAAHEPDGDAAFVKRVRAIVGDATPIVCSLDLHANISPALAALADELLVCRTYPHLDMAATGQRAASALARRLETGRPLDRLHRQVPFGIPTVRGCTLVDPARAVYRQLAELEKADGIEHLSFACGFLHADVPQCGPALVGYGDDRARVAAALDALERALLEHEPHFRFEPWTPVDAVTEAMTARSSAGPVIIADVDDNPGGGEAGDSTWLLHALLDAGARDALLGVLTDADACAAAHDAGVGATVRLALGGGAHSGPPVSAAFEVLALGDGRFRTTGEYFAGGLMDLGPMALLGVNDIRVVVSSRREQAADQAMFRHVGAEPDKAALLVLKSAVHYRADFQAMATRILEAGSPGRSLSPMTWRHLRDGFRPIPGT